MFDKTSQPPWHKRVAMYCLDAAFLLASLLAVAASARTLWLHIVQVGSHKQRASIVTSTEQPLTGGSSRSTLTGLLVVAASARTLWVASHAGGFAPNSRTASLTAPSGRLPVGLQ